jgi:hypothetical protein
MVVWKGRLLGVITVELVPGRETGEDEPGTLLPTSARSPAFLFFEEGRTGVERSGRPSARPAAAIPTVLDATSCKQLVYAFQISLVQCGKRNCRNRCAVRCRKIMFGRGQCETLNFK